MNSVVKCVNVVGSHTWTWPYRFFMPVIYSQFGGNLNGGTSEIRPNSKLPSEAELNALGAGARIPEGMPERSGWDVYNKEAKKVDMELVKDWTTSLNFLLIFVSRIFNITIPSLTLL